MVNNIQKHYCHISTNKNRTVLYIGYTDNLRRRISQHKNGTATLFTKRHSIYDLIHYETFEYKKIGIGIGNGT